MLIVWIVDTCRVIALRKLNEISTENVKNNEHFTTPRFMSVVGDVKCFSNIFKESKLVNI